MTEIRPHHPRYPGLREQVHILKDHLHSGLRAYIAVHDKCLRETSTYMSLIKNVFGTGVPMEDLLRDAESALDTWRGLSQMMRDFRRARPLEPGSEQQCIALMTEYADAMVETNQALVDRQRLLVLGKRRPRPPEYTLRAVRDKVRAYAAQIPRYRSLGQRLNQELASTFDV